jgi:hypothetical protein
MPQLISRFCGLCGSRLTKGRRTVQGREQITFICSKKPLWPGHGYTVVDGNRDDIYAFYD